MFDNILKSSILKRAGDKKLISTRIINLKDFAKDKHKTVDDNPYGGGAGMVLKVDVIYKALKSIKPKPYTILLSASGKKYTQKKAINFSKKDSIAIICGHYEGVDARVENFVDEAVSIGDFILTGGEIASMVIIDSVSRLKSGVISSESVKNESFSGPENLLEYPQYTKPSEFKNLKVPKILLSGNHAKIDAWRRQEAIKITKKNRPELLKTE
jgi:tRNA (guanine37-N1)-methyltransferase